MAWHYLRGNKSVKSPQQYICVDTETNSVQHSDTERTEVLRLGVAIRFRWEKDHATRREIFRFTTDKQFWCFASSVSDRHRTTWLVGHKIGFDLRALRWGQAIGRGILSLQRRTSRNNARGAKSNHDSFRNGIACLNDPPTIIDAWLSGNRRLKVVDTRNYIRSSLADIGDKLGLPKLNMPDRAASDADWYEYCERDCEIVERTIQYLLSFVRSNDLGMFRWTIAAQSMAAYRHRYMRIAPVIHDSADVSKLERRSYYGGQLQAYYLGEVNRQGNSETQFDTLRTLPNTVSANGPIYVLDCTSLYGSVMRDYPVPYRLRNYNIVPKGTPTTDLLPDANCIADVLLESVETPFPYRDHGTVTFPKGSYWTTLAGVELQRAEREGRILYTECWARYDTAPILRDYANGIFDLRCRLSEKGDAIGASLCKLMLCCVHGKFGQRSPKWVTVDGVDAPYDWGIWYDLFPATGEHICWRSLGGTVQANFGEGESINSFPAISAFICAAARERMRGYREIAGSRNVYYQAIDALHCTVDGYNNLLSAGCVAVNEMGKLRLTEVAQTATYYGNNHYKLDDREVIASVRSEHTITAGGDYSYDLFESLDNSVESPPHCGVRIKRVYARPVGKWAKGVAGQEGWIKTPTVNKTVRKGIGICQPEIWYGQVTT